jgi:hypothetical protein
MAITNTNGDSHLCVIIEIDTQGTAILVKTGGVRVANLVNGSFKIAPWVGGKPVSRCTLFEFDKESGHAEIQVFVLGGASDFIESILTADEYTSDLHGFIVKDGQLTDTEIDIFEKAKFEVTKLRCTIDSIEHGEVTTATITVSEVRE